MDHAPDCACDPCCNVRIGRPQETPRDRVYRVKHTRAVHLIKSWSGRAEDEAPLCGAVVRGLYPLTTSREPWDCAGNPMPLCPACVATLG